MFRKVLIAALVPLARGSDYSYTYDYTDAPTAAPTAETTTQLDQPGLRGRVVPGGGIGD